MKLNLGITINSIMLLLIVKGGIEISACNRLFFYQKYVR